MQPCNGATVQRCNGLFLYLSSPSTPESVSPTEETTAVVAIADRAECAAGSAACDAVGIVPTIVTTTFYPIINSTFRAIPDITIGKWPHSRGFGGGGGYMVQRYFAAKSDREAGLLSLFWILLLSFRWPLVTAFAMLGIHYSITKEAIANPELILPTVIAEYVPVGIKGLLIACFVAAAMSTFDSIINSSAAYWVKDIYQAYLKPGASESELVWQGRLASTLIVVIGLIFSFNMVSINDIWSFLTLGFGAGMAVPLVLRWYWWRFNGYGFAAGTFVGMVMAILTKTVILQALPKQYGEYALFLIPSLSSLLGCIIGTLTTPATQEEVMSNFYRTTRPFGFWGQISKQLPENIQAKIKTENSRDLVSTFIAVPWQLVLFLMGISLMMKRWDNFGILLTLFITLSITLYFTWFRHLSKEVKID